MTLSLAIERSQGGNTTQIPALTNALANLVDFRFIPKQAHELRAVPDLISDLSADHLLAGREFDTNWLREHYTDREITPVMPCKLNRHFPVTFNRMTCKWQHLIENYFGKLKDNSSIAIRSSKNNLSFVAFVSMAASIR